MDTPGGLSESMRKIVKAELASKIPVIVYVSPDGSRAASAGVWIGQAADILAMAPQTNIGSSTPINLGGTNIQSDLRRKIVNDAAASLVALAAAHKRNAVWAAKAVRVASNLPARTALRKNVIDVVAPTLPALLDEIDGRKTIPKGFVLHTAGAEMTTVKMGLWQRILDFADRPEPDLADALARRARDRRRALAPRADLPGHVRDPLPGDGLLRARRAAR